MLFDRSHVFRDMILANTALTSERKFSFHHHDLGALQLFSTMYCAFHDISYATRFDDSFGKMWIGKQTIQHCHNLVFEVDFLNLASSNYDALSTSFRSALKAAINSFISKYRTLVQFDGIEMDDLLTTFDMLMVTQLLPCLHVEFNIIVFTSLESPNPT